jgi:hypothetical protein
MIAEHAGAPTACFDAGRLSVQLQVRQHSAQGFLRLLFIGLTRLLGGQQDCCYGDEDPFHGRPLLV